ncbi:MAG TPA: PAS domain S-box protein [Terriglobales bacterium]|nr:PAS domain S-box protein [Terriglobales bacterium]
MTFFSPLTEASTKVSFKRYGFAILATIVALAGRSFLQPVLKDSAPFALSFAAVVFSALYCGLGPAVLTIVLAVLGTDYFFLLPRFTFGVSRPVEITRVVVFVFVSIVIIALTESNRRTIARHAQVAEKLDENEERFRFTFEQAAIGMAQLDLSGRFIRVNRAFCDILGCQPEDLLQITFKDITHPEHTEADLEGLEKLLNREIDQHTTEKCYIRKDGSSVWADLSVSLLRGRKSTPKYFIAILQDITKRKKSEDALRLSQERLALAQRAGHLGSFEWTIETNSSAWSDELLTLYGFSKDNVVKSREDWIECVVPEDRVIANTALDNALITGSVEIEFKIRRHIDSEVRWMYTRAQVIFDGQRNPKHLVGIQVDITDRKRSEEALRQAHDELEQRVQERTTELEEQVNERKRAEDSLRHLTGRLLQLQDNERRQIARELHDSTGQMVVALSLNLASLQSGAHAPESAKIIADCLSLLSELSRELRTMSHLLHPPLLDEAGLASALRWYVEGFAERSKIQVSLEIPDDIGRLSQEFETALFRIVQECLSNIHRHANSMTAEIRLSRSNDRIAVEVKDQGKGIPLEKQMKMATVGEAGVGIRGMRERVRQLGGDVLIDSNSSGTTVIASFPVTSPIVAGSSRR